MKRKKEQERPTMKKAKSRPNIRAYDDFDSFNNMFLNEVDGPNKFQIEKIMQEKASIMRWGQFQKKQDKNSYKYSMSPTRGRTRHNKIDLNQAIN